MRSIKVVMFIIGYPILIVGTILLWLGFRLCGDRW